MNVVINALSARLGGGQTYIKNLLRYPELFKGEALYILAPDSLKIPEHQRIKRVPIAFPTTNPLARAVWEKLMLPVLLKKLSAKVLFCPGGLINCTPPVGCKTVTMFRNMLPFDPVQKVKYPPGLMKMKLALLEKGFLRSMQSADLVIFISEFAKKLILERVAGHLKNAVTIPHGLSEQFRTAEKQTVPRPPGLPLRDYLLYVSIFHVYKNQLEVVRAFHLLRQKRRTPEMLVLAGHNQSEYGRRVRAEIKKLGLENDVILIGHVDYDQLPGLYHHAYLNIFASECENCPNSLLEAMGAGSPLVVSRVPPMPEFGQEAPIYFDPVSPADLAATLCTVLDDPELLNAMAERSRDRAAEFSWEETIRQTWAAITKL